LILADAIIADFPYGVTKAAWDRCPDRHWYEELVHQITFVNRADSYVMFFFHNHLHAAMLTEILEASFKGVTQLIWTKPNAVRSGETGSWASSWEMCTFCYKGVLSQCLARSGLSSTLT